jgi:ATP-dependent RNA helicase RhlE
LNFNHFNFHEPLLEGLSSMGFKSATPVQAAAIPIIQSNKDLIACAQTGTGKTAAYLLPIMDALSKMGHQEKPKIGAVILAPTRELAVQIDQQVEGLAYFTGISSIAIYGGGDGMAYEQQSRSLREGVDLIIATPGRLLAHLTSKSIKFDDLKFLVLDEADRMLDMGFKDDIMQIVKRLPTSRQTVMFSATMPSKIRQFAQSLLKNPEEINLAISQPAERIRQIQYWVLEEYKIALLKHILSQSDYKSVIIFSSTKEKVKLASRELKKLKLDIQAFHSDLKQPEREALLLQFKNRQLQILIGTDVLSRGIDVVGVDLVVNLDVPPDPEDYIHRIGRTARAEREGAAITFVTEKDIRKFVAIERLMNQEVEKIAVPEEIGPTPELVVLRKNIETGKNTHPKRNTNPKGKRPKKFFKNRKKSGGESPAAS